MLIRSGIRLIKYWFSIRDEEQQLRFLIRIRNPLKQWTVGHGFAISRALGSLHQAKEETFARTNIPQAPWYM